MNVDIVIETQRLFLRKLTLDDKNDLAEILSDKESMLYYPYPFSEQEVINWIEWNIDNYKKYNHGLWAVILKKDNVFLGDCGITMQNIENKLLPEIGYHIKKDYCNQGYATEAAIACKEYGFNTFDYDAMFTYTSVDNKPSIRVAEKNGMKKIKYFPKIVFGVKTQEVLYGIGRQTSCNMVL